MTMTEPNVLPPVELSSAQQQAIHWLVRLNAGDLNEAETLAFADWLSQDYRHSLALAEAEDVFNDMTAVANRAVTAAERPMLFSKQADQNQHPPTATTRANRIRRHRLTWRFGIAAVLAFAMVTLPPHPVRLIQNLLSDYHTATGELRDITLSDGSRLLLNTDTAISVDYSGERRRIRLYHGQAKFTVAADRQRPFEVMSNDLTERALGTVFEVYNMDTDGIRVTVQEHAVTVRAAADPAEPRTLSQGEQVLYRSGKTLPTAQPVDLELAGAWQQQRLLINDQPLAELIAELQRYRRGGILLSSAELKNQRITGVFPLNNPEQIVESIRKILALKQTRIGPWTILHR